VTASVVARPACATSMTMPKAFISATCEGIAAPVICSRTSARLLHDFSGFLSDDELGAISATDGLVGLWPFRHNGKGIADPTSPATPTTSAAPQVPSTCVSAPT